MSTRLDERIIAITNSIMSGDNSCGTLAKAIQEGTLGDFVQKMVRPTLEVYESEMHMLRADRDALSSKCELMRQALDMVIANVDVKDPGTRSAIRAARADNPFTSGW